MARLHAAKGTTCPDTVWGAYSLQANGDKGPQSDGQWLKPLAVVAGLLFVACLVEFVFTLTTTMHEQLLVNASSDLEFYSTAIWRELREAINSGKDANALIEPLARIAPGQTTARGRRILITDPSGVVAVSWPRLSTTNMKLSEIFGEDGAPVDNAGEGLAPGASSSGTARRRSR